MALLRGFTFAASMRNFQVPRPYSLRLSFGQLRCDKTSAETICAISQRKAWGCNSKRTIRRAANARPFRDPACDIERLRRRKFENSRSISLLRIYVIKRLTMRRPLKLHSAGNASRWNGPPSSSSCGSSLTSSRSSELASENSSSSSFEKLRRHRQAQQLAAQCA